MPEKNEAQAVPLPAMPQFLRKKIHAREVEEGMTHSALVPCLESNPFTLNAKWIVLSG